MRYVSIALFLFSIQCSLAILNALMGPGGLAGVLATSQQPANDWVDSVNDKQLANESYVQSSISASATSTSFGFGDFIKGFYYFVKAVGLGVVAVPYTLSMLGLIAPFTYYFSAVVYFMYFLGIAQFIANRSMRGMN